MWPDEIYMNMHYYMIIIASEFCHYFVLQLIMENLVCSRHFNLGGSQIMTNCFLCVHLNGFNAIMFLFCLCMQSVKTFEILNLVLPYFNVKEVKFHIVCFTYQLNKCFNGLFSDSKIWPAGYHNYIYLEMLDIYQPDCLTMFL